MSKTRGPESMQFSVLVFWAVSNGFISGCHYCKLCYCPVIVTSVWDDGILTVIVRIIKHVVLVGPLSVFIFLYF